MGVKGLASQGRRVDGICFCSFFAQRRLAFFFELGYTHVSSSSLDLSFQLP